MPVIRFEPSKRFPIKHRDYVLGFDVGGGHISVEAYQVVDGKVAAVAHLRNEEKSAKEPGPHAAQVARMIDAMSERLAGDHCNVIAVGVCSPGRFSQDGPILDGTNPHMGENQGAAFNGVNLKDIYRNALKAYGNKYDNLPLFVGNDANAMIAGYLQALQANALFLNDLDQKVSKYTILDRQMAILGIGTGIGHSIVKVDKQGNYKYVTDGHASKIKLVVDEADRALFQKAVDGLRGSKHACLELPDGAARAEDLFKSDAIAKMAGVADNRQIDLNNSDHQKALQFAGKYMGRLIAQIKSGNIEDVNPSQQWSADDMAIAAKTDMYFIGGGTGTSPLGKELIRYAKAELQARDIDDVRLVQYVGEEKNCQGAAAMIPAEYLSPPRKTAIS